jgi:hypothetical protein
MKYSIKKSLKRKTALEVRRKEIKRPSDEDLLVHKEHVKRKPRIEMRRPSKIYPVMKTQDPVKKNYIKIPIKKYSRKEIRWKENLPI